MRSTLQPHPDCVCPPIAGIDVQAVRIEPGTLELRYLLHGTIGELLLPPAGEPERSDGLWQHTCFEAFVASPGAAGYRELNLAPSRRWAAYDFTGYRSGMSEAPIEPPRIEIEAGADRVELRAQVTLEALAAEPRWRLGLSAVIEERGGRKSYWALAHPPGEPDFHHPACFALELPPPTGA